MALSFVMSGVNQEEVPLYLLESVVFNVGSDECVGSLPHCFLGCIKARSAAHRDFVNGLSIHSCVA